LTIGKQNELHAQAEPRINEWNAELAKRIETFGQEHLDISAFLFDAYSVFKRVLDDPRTYDFVDADQVCLTPQCIWADKIHPSSPVHRILASELAKFLNTL
jgi:phospholipase/lecithinase/hemolysin